MRAFAEWLLCWLVLALLLLGFMGLAVWLLAVWIWEEFCSLVVDVQASEGE